MKCILAYFHGKVKKQAARVSKTGERSYCIKKKREREKSKETCKTKVSWSLNYLVTHKIRVIDSQSF